MNLKDIRLPAGKKVYFASDFHLGAPNRKKSIEREKKIVRWLDSISADAHALFLLGDLFDFWFEYKHAVPKGGVRLQGKLAEMSDAGLPIYIFSGNHDMWMKNYFPEEFGISVYHQPLSFHINESRFMLGHGDGLGPGDRRFKMLKKVFRNPLSIWLFGKVHPDLGIGIANTWSKTSRASHMEKDSIFLGENEWLLAYCKEVEGAQHHDYYVFGHRHLPLDLEVASESRYINLGEWLSHNTYGVFDGKKMNLHQFKDEA
ncbi:UDP-2,3-diacylglucosamine diphosphatase [Nafulsella turpanensis]|uniref:UDP-2,3-diacylglucosamine diphosphatase n=1 Tax=Nafulsella turpanensis TaxID=1265690 RepID=UPI0003497DC0|nr:UDP-2,3-diacylglucosamine diphosphatase [Nafulsella turpanensis]